MPPKKATKVKPTPKTFEELSIETMTDIWFTYIQTIVFTPKSWKNISNSKKKIIETINKCKSLVDTYGKKQLSDFVDSIFLNATNQDICSANFVQLIARKSAACGLVPSELMLDAGAGASTGASAGAGADAGASTRSDAGAGAGADTSHEEVVYTKDKAYSFFLDTLNSIIESEEKIYYPQIESIYMFSGKHIGLENPRKFNVFLATIESMLEGSDENFDLKCSHFSFDLIKDIITTFYKEHLKYKNTSSIIIDRLKTENATYTDIIDRLKAENATLFSIKEELGNKVFECEKKIETLQEEIMKLKESSENVGIIDALKDTLHEYKQKHDSDQELIEIQRGVLESYFIETKRRCEQMQYQLNLSNEINDDLMKSNAIINSLYNEKCAEVYSLLDELEEANEHSMHLEETIIELEEYYETLIHEYEEFNDLQDSEDFGDDRSAYIYHNLQCANTKLYADMQIIAYIIGDETKDDATKILEVINFLQT